MSVERVFAMYDRKIDLARRMEERGQLPTSSEPIICHGPRFQRESELELRADFGHGTLFR